MSGLAAKANGLVIEADWEKLETGPLEERAAFAAIGIRHFDLWLTEAEDAFVKRIREKAFLSGYRLAEWLAWNWWRLRWEPKRHSLNWSMAHMIATIGGGYVWPNVTIVSDGELIALFAKQTAPNPCESLRYISQTNVVVKPEEFETAIDFFIEQVVAKLKAEGVNESNLERIWHETKAERSDEAVSQQRRLEAMMGLDPDEADTALIRRLMSDAKKLGNDSIQELAADRIGNELPVSAAELFEIAKKRGIQANPRDGVDLESETKSSIPSDVVAWKRGAKAAEALRKQEGLDQGPVTDQQLCELLGILPAEMQSPGEPSLLSFALRESLTKSYVILRSKYQTNRRFDLARLLGDRVAIHSKGRLLPATRSYTYRQKVQRAFAGEFLCPYEALADKLKDDLSAEAIADAAAHFNVSELAIRTHLVNHGRLGRDELLGDVEITVA
jgi:Zn-dependent peptidase ImmA (M78 family)